MVIMNEIKSNPKIFSCFITHINVEKNGIEIWAQNDSTIASKVESSLHSYHKQLSDLFAIRAQHKVSPDIGKFYVTHMKNDLHFYRVVVTHYNPNANKALVLFIDFGNEEWVAVENLIEFQCLFIEKSLAERFLLADIRPPNIKKGWNLDKVKLCLDSFIGFVFQCEVIDITNNTECIRLYDHNFNQPLIEKLRVECNGIVDIQFANSLSNQLSDSGDVLMDSQNDIPFVDSFIAKQNSLNEEKSCSLSLSVETNDSNFVQINSNVEQNVDIFSTFNDLQKVEENEEFINDLKKIDKKEELIDLKEVDKREEFINDLERVEENEQLINDLKKVEENEEVIASDTTQVEHAINSSKLLGTKSLTYITCLESMQAIYCQFCNKYDEIQTFIEDMSQYYNEFLDSKDHELNEAEVKIGDLIAALYSCDELWYRASICAINQNSLEIFYIDFGNKEVIHFKSGKQLVTKFQEMPPQVIHCSLINTNDFTEAKLKEIELNMTEIECQFVESDGDVFKVRLTEINGQI